MGVTIVVHARDDEASFTVPDVKSARKHVSSFFTAKMHGHARFIVDGGEGTCLNIPVHEVIDVSIQF